jgi:hypothetical protein
MYTLKIGDRVEFNDGVSPPYVGKMGEIVRIRQSVICGEVYEVELDEPTAAARGWPVNKILGAGAHCMDAIRR